MNSSISSSKRGFVLKLAVHMALLTGLLLGSPRLASAWLQRKYGPSTKEQIDRAFQTLSQSPPFETLLLGNSRIYRGINPERWQRTYNFAHDGDSFNQVYYKLSYLESKGKLPQRVVLGVDYFSFSHLDSSRVEFYAVYFPPEFSRDFWIAPPPQRWGEPANLAANAWMDRHFQNVFPLLLQAGSARPATLSQGGQYRVAGDARKPYLRSAYNPVRRDSSRLPLLCDYFQRSLEFCRLHRIEVVLLMPPLNHFERDAYTPRARMEFWRYLSGYRVPALSFENDPGFGLRDYLDFTHLKLEAADRLSDLVWRRLPKAASESRQAFERSEAPPLSSVPFR